MFNYKMSVKTINKISYIFAIISILLIVLGCIAPIIFTQCKSIVDFTQTGQIGDTIGGTMGPIVAIAGVFMTFIAFLMQVNANKIQSSQLKKALSLKLLEEKIESRNALQLMCVDINVMINSIDKTCLEIDDFCSKTENLPTGEVPFHFVPFQSCRRYNSIDRNHVYNAFASFMEPSGHIDDFSAIYSLLDFYSEGMESIYSVIYKPYTDEIMACKNEIPRAFEELHHALNDNISNKSQSVLVQQFNYQVTNRLINNGILNIMELHKTLDDIKYNSLFEVNFNAYQKTLALTNSLITKNNMLVKAMRDAKVKLLDQEVYNRLIELRDKIDNVLIIHTIETIQKDFENQV